MTNFNFNNKICTYYITLNFAQNHIIECNDLWIYIIYLYIYK